MVVRLVAQTNRAVGEQQFRPGDVLPESLHAWALLPAEVARGAVWVDGRPSGHLTDQQGSTVDVERVGGLLAGLVRRGQIRSDGDPPELHAAAYEQSRRMRKTPIYPAVAPVVTDMPPAVVVTAEDRTAAEQPRANKPTKPWERHKHGRG